MRRIALSVTILLLWFVQTATGAENPCRQRIISQCGDEPGGAICRLLEQDAPESTESISEFLQAISKYDIGLQQDFICARLMGKKEFRDISTTLSESPDGNGKYAFRDGPGTWRFKVPDPAYGKWVDAHKLIDRLELCAERGLNFDMRGLVVDVDVTYSDGVLKNFSVELEDVTLTRIETLYAKGNFDSQTKPLLRMTNREYDQLMNVGISGGGRGDGQKPLMESNPTTQLKPYRNSLGMEFVLIPAGEFIMGDCGSSDEQPLHRVKITKPFYMGRHEVTQGQWKAVMGNNPSKFSSCGDNCPVEQVSWEDVQKFIQKLNVRGEGEYRLPTEAEWEYAARAGSNAAYSFGGDEAMLGQYAWYVGNSGGKTHPVGEKKPNDWGLYDMHGNVWEWCQDWYGGYQSGTVTNPEGPDTGAARVLRGGSWFSGARGCRSASRDRYYPSPRYADYGFRLVLSPGQQAE